MVEDLHSESLCFVWFFEFEDGGVTDEVHDNECSKSDDKADSCHEDENNDKRSLCKSMNT